MAITEVKEKFASELSDKLKLFKVSSPIAVMDKTGINDDLNGTEKPVKFPVKSLSHAQATVVQSLAKWKRLRLAELELEPGSGILTDMRALRPDEDISPIHSVYVDQWDWEKVITDRNRSMLYLKETVRKIYEALKETEKLVCADCIGISPVLPEKITFIDSEELRKQYPGLSPKDRENRTARKYGAVFITGIGGKLGDGKAHDLRAPDYDDWSTLNEEGNKGLNGDIIVWNPALESAFEISSMGIRVDKASLVRQLKSCKQEERKNLHFHRMLLEGKLPLTIGGGIGQSRVVMFMLRKKSILRKCRLVYGLRI